MKKFLLFASVASLGLASSAQVQMSLSDEIYLADIQHNGTAAMSVKAPGVPVCGALVQISDESVIGSLEAAGATVENIYGSVAVIQAPIAKMADIFAVEGVISAKIDQPAILKNDLARAATNVDKVHQGEGLIQAYDGTGVVVGAYDQGVDPNHITFRDANGKSRVVRALKYPGEMSSLAQTYVPDFLMDEFEQQNPGETVYDIATYNTDMTQQTHGTHVLGIMAGSFKDPESETDYRGVATGAEIFMAGGSGYQGQMLDATEKLAKYAQSVGKPAVLNMSWGGNRGSHDASDPFNLAFDELIDKYGVLVFMSSGNEGDYPIGMYKEFTEQDQTLRTFLTPTEYTSYPNFGGSYLTQSIGTVTIWSNDDTPFKVYLDVVGLDSPDTPLYSFEIPENQKKFMVNGRTPSGVTASQIDRNVAEFNTFFSNSYVGGFSQISGQNNRYHTELAINLNSKTVTINNTHAIAIRVEGQTGQRINMYAEPTYGAPLTGFSNRDKEGYDECVGDGTFNSMAGGNNVISVGAYNTRQSTDQIPGYGYIYEPEANFPGVSSFSSWGHQSDGSLRPHVLAPGFVIISAASTPYMKAVGSNADANGTPSKYKYYDSESATTYQWTIMAGTSQAAPHMAGIAALWLQADPTLTKDDILNVIEETSYKPDNASDQWGPNGLVNAYEGLKRVIERASLPGVTIGKGSLMIQPKGNGLYEVASPAENGITASVVNLQGVEVAKAACNGNQLEISARGLQPGVYVLTAKSATETISKKIAVK